MRQRVGVILNFICKLLIVAAAVALTVGGYFVATYLLNKDKPSSFGPELYYAIDLAGTNTGYEKVILGDSVARQIFAPEYQSESEDTCYLATNQAITVLGNYLLLNRYLADNPQTKEVVYILRPQSLANPLWYNYSFQYFVVPFYNKEYMPLILDETKDYIEERFGKMYTTNEVVKGFTINTPYFLDAYLNNNLEQQLEERDEKSISDIALVYLPMMDKLCRDKGISFRVIASPLPDTADNRNWSTMQAQVEMSAIADLLADYFDNINYFDEKYFMDEAHFTEEYLKANRDMIIETIFLNKN